MQLQCYPYFYFVIFIILFTFNIQVHANSANEKVSENKIQYTLAEKQYKERQFEMAKETLLSLMDDTEYEARWFI